MIRAKLEQSNLDLKQGRLAQAQAGYEEILRLEPGHFSALRMFGVIARRRRQPRRAMEFAGRAIAADPVSPAAHFDHGLALSAMNRMEDALRSY